MTDTKTPVEVVVGPSLESEQAACYIMAHWLLTDQRRNPITFRDAEKGEKGVVSIAGVVGKLCIKDGGFSAEPLSYAERVSAEKAG